MLTAPKTAHILVAVRDCPHSAPTILAVPADTGEDATTTYRRVLDACAAGNAPAPEFVCARGYTV